MFKIAKTECIYLPELYEVSYYVLDKQVTSQFETLEDAKEYYCNMQIRIKEYRAARDLCLYKKIWIAGQD